jgi:hypothetical protein
MQQFRHWDPALLQRAAFQEGESRVLSWLILLRLTFWVGGILGLTASDVQLGAALPDGIPPLSFVLAKVEPASRQRLSAHISLPGRLQQAAPRAEPL